MSTLMQTEVHESIIMEEEEAAAASKRCQGRKNSVLATVEETKESVNKIEAKYPQRQKTKENIEQKRTVGKFQSSKQVVPLEDSMGIVGSGFNKKGDNGGTGFKYSKKTSPTGTKTRPPGGPPPVGAKRQIPHSTNNSAIKNK